MWALFKLQGTRRVQKEKKEKIVMPMFSFVNIERYRDVLSGDGHDYYHILTVHKRVYRVYL